MIGKMYFKNISQYISNVNQLSQSVNGKIKKIINKLR